ncbi:MAG: NADH-quinone oxidoreductase subunit K [Candidatus Aminicenantes bacterium RBG_13_64_14]|nr:MAG: NADH-quinone oxidoreductase subunit K [Candidatus Aminicenantes bacterium RBG_13_64_14]
MIPIEAVVGLGLLIFTVGLAGVLVRKNLVVMLMSLELLLNGVNIILAGLGRHLKSPRGSIFALFVIIIAVSEAAVGFALVLAYFRHKKSYDTDVLSDLKG